MSDEFLAVLPTAAEKVALEIIERIERVLITTPFEISDKEYTNIQFNFGWATFWKDGETAQQLLQNALLRKQQSKSIEPSKVLWFPREYVN
jgi:GGDEF domain-containing protein